MSNSNPSRPKSALHLAYTNARHVFDEMASWPPCTRARPTWPTRVQALRHAPPRALLLQNRAPVCLLASLTHFHSPRRSSSARTHARARPPWMPPWSSLLPALLQSLGLVMPSYTLVAVHRPLLSLASPSPALLRRRSAVAAGAAIDAPPAHVARPTRAASDPAEQLRECARGRWCSRCPSPPPPALLRPKSSLTDGLPAPNSRQGPRAQIRLSKGAFLQNHRLK